MVIKCLIRVFPSRPILLFKLPSLIDRTIVKTNVKKSRYLLQKVRSDKRSKRKEKFHNFILLQ